MDGKRGRIYLNETDYLDLNAKINNVASKITTRTYLMDG